MDTYLIPNSYGTIVKLRVPAGMDLNEALNSIIVAISAEASAIPTDAIQTAVKPRSGRNNCRY